MPAFFVFGCPESVGLHASLQKLFSPRFYQVKRYSYIYTIKLITNLKTMIIDITDPAIHYDPIDRTFVAELSSLERTRFEITELCWKGSPIWVRNSKTGTQLKMTRAKVVQTDSGEDTAGWWYRGFNPANGVSFKFLFIND